MRMRRRRRGRGEGEDELRSFAGSSSDVGPTGQEYSLQPWALSFQLRGDRESREIWGGEAVPNPGNLAFASVSVQNRLSMGHRLPQELLLELRTYLQHFDQTGHIGESETVT